MNKKLTKSLIALGSVSLTAIPVVSLVSLAPNESSKGFIFKGRIFHSNEDAMKYLINNKLIDVSETKVVGDLPHAFSNAEKGLINKYLLPDYVPRNMHFAYFNKGGSITRDYDAAKNSYYSLGDSSIRYFDGFGSSFPNALEAQRSMRQKIVGGGSLGFYNVPFINPNALGNDNKYILKRINPLNSDDVSKWENNISENISQIIEDNIKNKSQSKKYTIQFDDKTLVNNNVFDQIKQGFNSYLSSGNKTLDDNGNLIYSQHGYQTFSWKQDSWEIGDWTANEDKDYWIGVNADNERIKVHARDHGNKNDFFKIIENNNYKFTVSDFNKLIAAPSSNEGDMHSLAVYSKEPVTAFNVNDISNTIKNQFDNQLEKYIASKLPMKSLNLSTANLSKLLTEKENLDFSFDKSSEKIDFNSNNINCGWTGGWYSHGIPNYFYLDELSGSISYNHSIVVPGFKNAMNTIYEKMENNGSLINQLIKVGKNVSTPITICKDNKPIFSGTLTNDGEKYKFTNVKVSERNHDAPSQLPSKDDSQFTDPLYAINCLVNDLKAVRDSSNPDVLKQVLNKWNQKTEWLVSELSENIFNNEKLNVEDNPKKLVLNIKMLISKYGSSNSLLSELKENILKINPNQFVFLDESSNQNILKSTEYVIDSIDKINPKFYNWDAPTSQEEYQKLLAQAQNIMPPAVQVLYDPDGKQFISDNYQFDTEGVMEYNFLRDISVRRDNDHIYIDGYSNPFSNVITSIYHLHINDEDLYFDTFNHLKEYTYQYIIDNSQTL